MKTSFEIKEPGLNVLPPGVERHVINAGGLTGLQIFPDDEIEIINDEGNQICEIIVFDKNGKSEPGILNLKENSFGIEPELTIKLAKKKYIFYEVPISYEGRSYNEGKKIRLKDAFIGIYCIFKYGLFS